ncbi:unnamed protein product [Peniophora sp. CBMAI 1063]|nr:unnamed protein product [Peniophora sp. CBMAI 1063]
MTSSAPTRVSSVPRVTPAQAQTPATPRAPRARQTPIPSGLPAVSKPLPVAAAAAPSPLLPAFFHSPVTVRFTAAHTLKPETPAPPPSPEPAPRTRKHAGKGKATQPATTPSRHPVITPEFLLEINSAISRLSGRHRESIDVPQASTLLSTGPRASSSSDAAHHNNVMEDINRRIAKITIPGKSLQSVAVKQSSSGVTFTMLNGENAIEVVDSDSDGEHSPDSDHNVYTDCGDIWETPPQPNEYGGSIRHAHDDVRAVNAAVDASEAKHLGEGSRAQTASGVEAPNAFSELEVRSNCSPLFNF